ncbi:MAG: hypothetical protein HYV65_00495 [Candidatus Spechtbacteria bacterium]|nr:hypothetical protein [Candidatus Spechtbacteria bacterium]
MGAIIQSLKKLIDEDRKERAAAKSRWEDWRGSILGFLELGSSEPWVFDNAAQRIFRRVCVNPPGLPEGVPALTIVSHETNPRRARALGLSKEGPLSQLIIPTYLAQSFFDFEEVLNEFYLFLSNAAQGGITSRNIFFLKGGVGVGKSRFVEAVQQLIVDDAMFVIQWPDSEQCPVNHSPLWAIPLHLRGKISREIGHAIHPTKDVCPVCSEHLSGLGNKWEDTPIVTKRISARRGQGLVKIPPFDPNTMGIEILIGSEKIRLMSQYDAGSARLMNFSGAFNRGTGGVIEWIEMFKAPQEALHLMLIATEDDRYPSPGYRTTMSSDFVIIAHSNLSEFERQSRNPDQEALFDRMVVQPVRYAMAVSEDRKIHDKILRQRSVRAHRAPETEDFLASVAVYSRIEEEVKSDKTVPMKPDEVFALLKLLDGDGGEGSEERVAERRANHPDEGFQGFSTRFLQRALESSFSRVEMPGVLSGEEQQATCVTLDDARASLTKSLTNRLVRTKGDERVWLTRMRDAVNGFLAVEFERRARESFINHLTETGFIPEIFKEVNRMRSAQDIAVELREELDRLPRVNGNNRTNMSRVLEIMSWFFSSSLISREQKNTLRARKGLTKYCPVCFAWNLKKACEPLA